MGLVTYLVRANSWLVKDLKVAHIRKSPEEFMKQAVFLALILGTVTGLVAVLFVTRFQQNFGIALVAAFFGFVVSFMFVLQSPKGTIRKREREINKEVLFAGRYLLVKLESGMPLFNVLIEISNSYGVAAKYFKEIVDDIETGSTLEEALDKAREYSASKKFQRILWQIVASLKTGMEVSSSLKATLHDITEQQIIEIKSYGRTLNSLMLFYMIIGCVLPSLGFALFTIFSSFLSLTISPGIIFVLIFVLAVIQTAFIILIKASRPMVNL